MRTNIKFILISNINCTYKIPDDKQIIIDRINHEIDTSDGDISAIIMAGDLTNSGYDGARILCLKYGGDENQLKTFIDNVIFPLESKINIYLCPGEHDTFVRFPKYRKPVYEYIKKRHGSLLYSFTFTKHNN